MNSNLYVHLSFTSGDNFVKKTRGKSKINTLLGTRTSVPRQRDKRFIATSVCVQGKALHCRGTARGRVHCTGTGKSVKIYPLAYFILFLLSFPVKKKIWEASGRVLVVQAVNRVWRAHRRHDDGRKRVGQ